MATAIKPWYKIKDNVEYSTDFDFFLKNQIAVSRRGITYSFYSRLEAKTFELKKAIFGDHEFSDKQINDFCEEIHTEILAGKHGVGEFLD